MAAPNTQTLLDDAKCIQTCIPDGMQMSILISLFAKIANVSTDPTTLMDNAKCIFTCIPPGMQGAVLISLAAQVASSPGGGGLSGSGEPEGNVTANPGTTYLDTDTNSFWVKKTGTGNTGWIGLIS